MREEGGVPARILLEVDVDAEKVRNEVIGMLGGVRDAQAGAGDVPAPLAPDVERVRADKERALEEQDFERAAYLRDRELELLGGRARDYGSTGLVQLDPSPRTLAVALVVAAVGFPLGLLIGWLIWG